MFGIRKKQKQRVDIPLNTPIKVEKTKVRKLVCTRACPWCKGTGVTGAVIGSWHLGQCKKCKGKGGEFEYRMVVD